MVLPESKIQRSNAQAEQKCISERLMLLHRTCNFEYSIVPESPRPTLASAWPSRAALLNCPILRTLVFEARQQYESSRSSAANWTLGAPHRPRRHLPDPRLPEARAA